MPDDLDLRHFPLYEISPSINLYRSHPREYDAVHFSRDPANRWCAPSSQYGVCYLARQPAGAFAETFLRQPSRTLISIDELSQKQMTEVRSRRSLIVVPFFGPFLSQLGATAAVTSGDVGASTLWSQVLYSHPDRPDGIMYRLRHDNNEFGIALFDRCQNELLAAASWGWAAALEEFGLFDKYQIAIG